MTKSTQIVGILGKGEIGSAISRLCQEAGFHVLIKELNYDEIGNHQVDYLHVNIPEKSNKAFIRTVVKVILQTKPKLTIINSSVTPGTTRKIYALTKNPIVHSPVMGIHPNLFTSIKYYFPKIIGPINGDSLKLAKRHFKNLQLKVAVYDRPEDSESAKLLDLIYYAWNIIFCKWVFNTCQSLNLNFDQVYTTQNQIYNQGYSKLVPQVTRPILKPVKGPITGHCTIPDTILFHKYFPTQLTKFIINENNNYSAEEADPEKERSLFLKERSKTIKKKHF